MPSNSAGVARGEGEQLRDVDADHAVGVAAADLGRDHRAGVVAVRAVALVAEPAHQLGPCAGDARRAPARLAGRPGEADAGERRDHEVERVGGVGAVGAGIGQRADHVEVLDDRHRPAVRRDQRQGIRLWGLDVQEVDLLPVDRGHELRVRVDARLLRAPVVPGAPVVDELADVVARNAVAPVHARQLVRPADAAEAVGEVVEVALGDVDLEGAELGAGCRRGHGKHLCSRGTKYFVPKYAKSGSSSTTLATNA